jgi:hypothetical protein
MEKDEWENLGLTGVDESPQAGADAKAQPQAQAGK